VPKLSYFIFPTMILKCLKCCLVAEFTDIASHFGSISSCLRLCMAGDIQHLRSFFPIGSFYYRWNENCLEWGPFCISGSLELYWVWQFPCPGLQTSPDNGRTCANAPGRAEELIALVKTHFPDCEMELNPAKPTGLREEQSRSSALRSAREVRSPVGPKSQPPWAALLFTVRHAHFLLFTALLAPQYMINPICSKKLAL